MINFAYKGALMAAMASSDVDARKTKGRNVLNSVRFGSNFEGFYKHPKV